jgi:hypothetical protein
MPQYINVNALKQASQTLVRPLAAPLPRSAALLTPTPHQFYLTLKPEQIPPNVRIQGYIERPGVVQGLTRVDKYGGRKTKDHGKDEKLWRTGAGRQGRRSGGLLWALREK